MLYKPKPVLRHMDLYDCIGRGELWPYLLRVVGHVWEHGGYVEHDLVALVGGIQGMGARRIGCRKELKDILI